MNVSFVVIFMIIHLAVNLVLVVVSVIFVLKFLVFGCLAVDLIKGGVLYAAIP